MSHCLRWNISLSHHAMLLLSTYNDSPFFCEFLPPIQINNSKESIFKTVWNLGWMEMRQKGGRNGRACCLWWVSALSQNTALSFDTMTYLWFVCYFLLVHKETNRKPKVSPCRQNKSSVVHYWVYLVFYGISTDNFWLILLAVISWTGNCKDNFKLWKWKDVWFFFWSIFGSI